MLRGRSEDKACLMLRRAELEKEWLRWGTLYPEAVCLVEEQDKTAGLWEARAEGSKQQPGALGAETENFLQVLEEPQKMRSPACFLGRSASCPPF